MSFKMFMLKDSYSEEINKIVASERFKDETGNPVEWEVKKLSSAELDRISQDCMREVQIPGKPFHYRYKTDIFEMRDTLIDKAVIKPDLRNVDLQDFYGVSSPIDLLYKLLPDNQEFSKFIAFVQELNTPAPLEEEVEKVKN